MKRNLITNGLSLLTASASFRWEGIFHVFRLEMLDAIGNRGLIFGQESASISQLMKSAERDLTFTSAKKTIQHL
jgi:hypothetical protein